MNDIVLNIISVVVTSVIIPLITYLGLKLSTYLKTKINNEKAKNYIEQATNAVTMAVTKTMQTYVDSLKASGNFNEEAQKAAYEKAKAQALALITKDAKNAVATLYGDFNEWLNAQIETQVKEIKEG